MVSNFYYSTGVLKLCGFRYAGKTYIQLTSVAMLHLPQSFTIIVIPFFFLVFNWGDVDGLPKNARSIPNAKSVSASAQCWNHSWQAIPRSFPYTIATKVLPHLMQDTAIGILFAYIHGTGFLVQHYT